MIQKTLIDKILRGERVRMTISGVSDKKVTELRDWLTQFRRSCGGTQFINCNSTTLPEGAEKLDVRIGVIPHGQRELLAGTLSAYDTHDSPFTIEETGESSPSP